MREVVSRLSLPLLVCVLMVTACSTTNSYNNQMVAQIDRGVAHYNQGQYDMAAAMWNAPAQQGYYAAQHNLGILWRDGLGSTQRNLSEAANWFLLAAQQGYVPAMVRLAEVQSILGHDAASSSWLNLAARWGNNEAVQHLRSKGMGVPAADLLSAHQQQEAQLQALALGLIMQNNAYLMSGAPTGTPKSYGTSTYTNSSPKSSNGKSLGNLSSNPYAPNSTSNAYGAGSQYDPNSVNNPYGKYGSPYSNSSATNPYATDAPKLYDQDGNYRGKLSTNPYDPESVSNPYGRYGSPYSPESINNPYGAGSPYRTDSPNNPYGQGLKIYGDDDG